MEKEKASVQFIRMVREATDRVEVERFCERCQDHIKHSSHQDGAWEHIICSLCSLRSSYKTK